MQYHSSITVLLVTLLVTTACERPAAHDAGEPATVVTPGLLEQLKARYPSLREEPAPEPQPNDGADPGAVPASVRQVAPETVQQVVTGEATFYADRFEGRRTASGIPFRQNQLVAAHRAFPFGTLLRVTNTANDRSVNVRVVDRGPFGSGARAQRTVLDLSRRAATELGYIQAGRAQVRVEVLEWGERLPRAG
jgi:rare lipoprotein A